MLGEVCDVGETRFEKTYESWGCKTLMYSKSKNIPSIVEVYFLYMLCPGYAILAVVMQCGGNSHFIHAIYICACPVVDSHLILIWFNVTYKFRFICCERKSLPTHWPGPDKVHNNVLESNNLLISEGKV